MIDWQHDALQDRPLSPWTPLSTCSDLSVCSKMPQDTLEGSPRRALSSPTSEPSSDQASGRSSPSAPSTSSSWDWDRFRGKEDTPGDVELRRWLSKQAQFVGMPIDRLSQPVIVSLRDVSADVLDQVAFWEAHQFGVRTAEERALQYRAAFTALAGGRADPSPWGYLECLVVLDTRCGEPLGAASLVKNDLAPARRDHGLSPWLSAAFLKPKVRGLGLGARLVRRVAGAALQQGFEQLFVAVCPDKVDLNSWYERQGFEDCGEKLRGGFRILRKKLHASAHVREACRELGRLRQ